MRFIFPIAALALILAGVAGCSEKTQQETQEALSATGEAVKAAAEDTKENAQKVGAAVKAGVERGKEEFQANDGPEPTPDTTAPGTASGGAGDAHEVEAGDP